MQCPVPVPAAALTPTQAVLAAARRARLARFAAAAARHVAAQTPPEVTPEKPAGPLALAEVQASYDAGADALMAALLRPHKAPWFSIEAERGADQGPEVREIQLAVCVAWGVALADMLSPRRMAAIVLPRQVAVYLTREMTLLSLPQIGAKFGGRDHTTILASHRKITRLAARDPDLAARIAAVRETILAPIRPR